MLKTTATLALAGALALSGCTADQELGAIRTGPQVESPHLNAADGKALRDADGNEINIVTIAGVDVAAPTPAMASTTVAGPIATFQTLCMPNLSAPSAIKAAGTAAGFEMMELATDSYLGTRDSTDETLQINAFTRHKFECAVTTSDVADANAFRDSFFAAIGISHANGTGTGTVAGQSYTFSHDTNGGEALVVFAN